MELSNILGALTGNDAVGAISQNLKIDQKQVSSVISNALPSLLGAMQKNASTPGGAEALAKALGDHASNAGNIINNLKGADLVDGSKILGHIFGGDLSSVVSGISKQTGVATFYPLSLPACSLSLASRTATPAQRVWVACSVLFLAVAHKAQAALAAFSAAWARSLGSNKPNPKRRFSNVIFPGRLD